MTTADSEIKKLKIKIKELDLQLIAITVKIKKLTPETLGEHMEFSRHRDERQHELRKLEGDREALVEQINILNNSIAALELVALQAKPGPNQSLRKKLVYDRVQELMSKDVTMKKAEAISKVADGLDSTDTAVKKAYYDYEKDLKAERSRKASEKSEEGGDEDGISNDGKKSPKK